MYKAARRPFFGPLVEYICSGPVVAMAWEGKGVVLTGRKIIGATLRSDPAGNGNPLSRNNLRLDVFKGILRPF
jgi:nucleoside-diphosphate kinase